MFSYAMLSEATQPLYERLLQMDAASYRDFKESSTYREKLSHKAAFRAWWMNKARTGYRTTEDLLRYKRELFEVITANALAAEAV